MQQTGLNSLRANDYFSGDVKIIKKIKPGPVVFIVTNGIGAVEAVIRDSDFNQGDIVHIKGKVNEHRGRMQIEIDEIVKSNMDFEAIILQRSNPQRTELSIKSERLEKMKPVMLDIAKRIRKAVLEGQPIMIRHHNDADGIISGLSLEHACLKLMHDLNIDPKFMIFRSPSRAPFYASGDLFRDILLSKKLIEGQSDIKPLIIIADNGSSPEDKFGLSSLKTLGYEAMVIDHHNPVVLNNGITSVDEYLSHHLNPYKHGLDGKTSAGMLCYEIGRFVSENFEQPLFAAVSGIADRCDIQETQDYIDLTGLQKEDLQKIGTAIDYISYQLKHDGGKGVHEILFENQDFVNLIGQEVTKGFETQLQSTLPYLRTQNINRVILSTIDVQKYTMRFTYPSPGLVISRVQEIVQAEHKPNITMTLGYGEDMIIIRASEPILPVQTIIDTLQQKYPNANVDGGGHEVAGTIRFISAFRDTLLQEIKTMLQGIE